MLKHEARQRNAPTPDANSNYYVEARFRIALSWSWKNRSWPFPDKTDTTQLTDAVIMKGSYNE